MNNLQKTLILALFIATPLWTLKDMTFTMIIREPYPSLVMPSFTTSEMADSTVKIIDYEYNIGSDTGLTAAYTLKDLFPEVYLLRFPTNIRYAYFKEQKRKGSTINRDKKYGNNPLYKLLKFVYYEVLYSERPFLENHDEEARRLLFEKIAEKHGKFPEQVTIMEVSKDMHFRTKELTNQQIMRYVVIE